MKRLLFAAFILPGLAATAQQPVPLWFNNKSKKSKLENFFKSDTTGEKWRRFEKNMLDQSSLLPQSTFSHNTSRGKIYRLPIDNMPCLVPDTKQVAPMPLHKMPEGRMPYVRPKQPLIPKPDNEEKE